MTSKYVYILINIAILANSVPALLWINKEEFGMGLVHAGIVLMMIGYKMYLKETDKEYIVEVFD